MSKKKLIAIHEVSHTKKGKPVAPGKTFSSESHEALVASGAAKYFVDPVADEVPEGGDDGDDSGGGDDGSSDDAGSDGGNAGDGGEGS